MSSSKAASDEIIAPLQPDQQTPGARLGRALTNGGFSERRAEVEARFRTAIDDAGDYEIASEAIVVVDMVQSTFSTNLFGWRAVGRVVTRDLRRLARDACAPFGLSSVRTTGDGLLLTFRNRESAALAVPSALAGARGLVARVRDRNAQAPKQLRFDLRVGVHFGEVDIMEGNREGPAVAFAFRLEKISRESLSSALNPIDPRAFPAANYVICSEAVADVLDRIGETRPKFSCGLFKMKGFPGWWEVFLLESSPVVGAVPSPPRGA